MQRLELMYPTLMPRPGSICWFITIMRSRIIHFLSAQMHRISLMGLQTVHDITHGSTAALFGRNSEQRTRGHLALCSQNGSPGKYCVPFPLCNGSTPESDLADRHLCLIPRWVFCDDPLESNAQASPRYQLVYGVVLEAASPLSTKGRH
eukprot:CAMPEP_0174366012 /NCGR_PEP_ID=MMETSP0811_2-20130205/79474_1 /TAXON_ID=73025 ORGANISM="Eutreptiella gymnastica-like, Strain CCMP1594" /NCGR_SAMPLE_ID=MMETSP0811_2 /ASSEMBLY_ACC=CAM_ASM_000667 /LENGTH=148 /DNA_ID=CAMNT_0015507173 /DNA_START=264 /DNA_END=710 /DNA_ORIENTATION=+